MGGEGREREEEEGRGGGAFFDLTFFVLCLNNLLSALSSTSSRKMLVTCQHSDEGEGQRKNPGGGGRWQLPSTCFLRALRSEASQLERTSQNSPLTMKVTFS